MFRRVIVVAAVAALFVAGSSKADAVAWSAPVALQRNVSLSDSAGAIAAGQRVVAWEGNTGVWAAVLRTGGATSLQRITSAKIANVETRLLAMDARGDAVIAWETRPLPKPTGNGLPPGTLYLAYRRAGGLFGRPHQVARRTEGADVGIDARGEVTIVWRQAAARDHATSLEAVQRGRAGGYSSAVPVARGAVVEFSLAVDGRGDALLGWEQGSLVSPALHYATREQGGTFKPAVDLVSARQGASDLDVGIDAHGHSLVTWEGPYDGAPAGNPYRRVNVSSVDIDAARPGRPERLRTPGHGQLGDLGPEVVVDPRGDAAVIWDTDFQRKSGPRIEVARRRAGHAFAATKQIGTGDIGGGLSAAIGPSGALLVAWEHNFVIKASLATSAQAPLGKPVSLSSSQRGAAEPAVAIDRRGRGLALWQDLGPSQPAGRGSTASPLLFALSR
jgi:hypothetical protein